MNHQGILFDLDGTLVDSLRDLHAGVNHALGVLDRPPHDLERIRQFIGNGVRALLARSLLGPEEVPDGASDEVRQDCLTRHVERARQQDASRFERALEAFDEHYSAHCTRFTRPYPGVVEMLEELRARSLPLAVVSNKPERFTRQVLEDLELASYFDHVVGGDTTPHPKPHPAPVENAVLRLELEPARTLMVGDSPPDLLSGRRAGCRIVAVTYGFTSPERLASYEPDLTIDHPSELLR